MALQGWHAFISYSSRDRVKAEIVVRDLQAAGLTVWYDRDQIGPGDRIRESIDVGLTLSRLLLILVSQNSLKSRWVLNELDGGMIREIEQRRKFVVPVLIGRIKLLDLPSDIRGKKWIDLRSNFTTKYALHRQDILNLVASVTDATLDFRTWPQIEVAQPSGATSTVSIGQSVVEETLDSERGRQFIESRLQGHLSRLRWEGATVYMLDVDGLTGINKRFGQLVGDAVLLELARILSNYAAPPYIGRCGDDTFYLVSERWSGIGAELLAIIRRYKWKSLAVGLYVTCSIGAATLRANEAAIDWVVRATHGMLEAKKAGGNRIGPVPQMLGPHTSRQLRSYFS